MGSFFTKSLDVEYNAPVTQNYKKIPNDADHMSIYLIHIDVKNMSEVEGYLKKLDAEGKIVLYHSCFYRLSKSYCCYFSASLNDEMIKEVKAQSWFVSLEPQFFKIQLAVSSGEKD
jgi:hypothetical protein